MKQRNAPSNGYLPQDRQVNADEYVSGGEPLDNMARGLFAIARELGSIRRAVRDLGTGNAGTEMGAIEYLAVSVKEAADRLAGSISEGAERIADFR